jgi:hypothetical protein
MFGSNGNFKDQVAKGRCRTWTKLWTNRSTWKLSACKNHMELTMDSI